MSGSAHRNRNNRNNRNNCTKDLDLEKVFREHIDSDLCIITLEQLVEDSPLCLSRPHVLFRCISNLATALGFRQNGPKRNRLVGEASARAVEKYWRVLWLGHPLRGVPGIQNHTTVRGLCDLLCPSYTPHVPGVPSPLISCMRMAFYNYQQFFKEFVRRMIAGMGHKCDVPSIALQFLRHSDLVLRDTLRILAPSVCKHSMVAEALLTMGRAYCWSPCEIAKIMDLIGEHAFDLAFLRRVAAKNLCLISACPDLNKDAQFLLSLMSSNNNARSQQVVQLADPTVRRDGTFICDMIERYPMLYWDVLEDCEKQNPLYAVTYLSTSIISFNWMSSVQESKTLRGSFPFARLLFAQRGDIHSNGPYNLYEYFDERIREKLEVAVLAFKACEGNRAQRDNMCYALHITLYGNRIFLNLANIKDPEQSMRNAVLDRVRGLTRRKNRRPRWGDWHKEESECGFTQIEKKWLRENRPALWNEAMDLHKNELKADPSSFGRFAVMTD